MSHNLLIYPEVVAPQKYKKFLSFFEVVASERNTVKLIIENIGKETFPGGEISEGIFCEKIIGVSTFTVWGSLTREELPPIQPNNTFVTSFEKWTPWCPGLWKIKIKIKSKDDSKIVYYQSRRGKPIEGEWYQFLYAVDRHLLDLNLLLEQLLSKRG